MCGCHTDKRKTIYSVVCKTNCLSYRNTNGMKLFEKWLATCSEERITYNSNAEKKVIIICGKV